MIELRHLATYFGPNPYGSDPVVVASLRFPAGFTVGASDKMTLVSRACAVWFTPPASEGPVDEATVAHFLARWTLAALNEFGGGLTTADGVRASGEIQVFLPADSVNGKEMFDITLNKEPVEKPVAVDPYKILNATEKMVYNDGEWAQLYSNNLSEMAIFDEQGFSTSLAKRGVMNISYKDVNNDGILDGSNPPVRVNTLSTWILDESVDSWVRMPGSGADAGSKTMTVYFGMPGVYAVLGAQDQSVSNVKAYPVPFRPNGPQAGIAQGQTGTEAGGITFDNVPQGGNISIYTLDGRLVKKIEIPEVLSIQTMNWNVRTASGERVASGVYIWRVVSGSNSKTGKLMVIW